MADEPRPGTPLWVKVFGLVVIVLVLLVAVIVFTGLGGPHGPQRHGPSGDAGLTGPKPADTRPLS